jgi:hypothetical protein
MTKQAKQSQKEPVVHAHGAQDGKFINSTEKAKVPNGPITNRIKKK